MKITIFYVNKKGIIKGISKMSQLRCSGLMMMTFSTKVSQLRCFVIPTISILMSYFNGQILAALEIQ